MKVSELVKTAHQNALDHGFWDNPHEFGTYIALITSELSEALEEEREGKPTVYYSGRIANRTVESLTLTDVCKKPEGIAVELVDAILRICDLLGFLQVDVDDVLKIKMEYNKTREYKHGKYF